MGAIIGLTFEEKEELFVCPVCDKEYKKEKALSEHIKKEHSDYEPAQE